MAGTSVRYGHSETVWPVDWIKSYPIFPQYCPNSSLIIFTWKLYFLKEPKNLPYYLGYFCKQICNQKVTKIAQFGHTAQRATLCHAYVLGFLRPLSQSKNLSFSLFLVILHSLPYGFIWGQKYSWILSPTYSMQASNIQQSDDHNRK